MHVRTDQPGRVLAVFVFAPLLLWKGIRYRDLFLMCFAITLFCWDAYWLVYAEPRRAEG